MTIAVDLGRKAPKQTNKQNKNMLNFMAIVYIFPNVQEKVASQNPK